jgi:CubicO group peptidase (beta-lactamase class C family)
VTPHRSIRIRLARTVIAASALALAPAEWLHAQRAGITRLPDDVVARIDRVFAALGGPDAPGCAVGLSRNGEPVLTRAYGMANLEYGVPNTPETIFESGSVAKQFTSAAVVLLAQEGRLSLDDDVRRYLPEVPDFGKKITIRNLLTHTSGLRDQWGLLSLKGAPPGSQVHTFNTVLDLVSRQKALNFDPGAEHLYSNTGYTLAAIIVQRVSGQPFATFTQERLFRPLGMTSTRWRDDFTTIVKGRATAYSGTRAAGFHTEMPFTNVIGNGGLLTTVGDLLTWNAFLDAPSPAVGGRALVDALETPMILNNGRKSGYALGLNVGERDLVREITHGGATAGYRTWLARYPNDSRSSVAVLCNVSSANATNLGNQASLAIVPRIIRTYEPAVKLSLSPGALERYTGLLRDTRSQSLLRTVVKDGRLVSETLAGMTLVPVETDRFWVYGRGEIAYRFDGGRLREVLAVSTEGDTTRYEPVTPAAPTAAALSAYVGTYWSDELETRFRIIIRDGALVVQQRLGDEVPLVPTIADGFTSSVGTVLFSRDAAGQVIGFGIWAGRIRDVRFRRIADSAGF